MAIKEVSEPIGISIKAFFKDAKIKSSVIELRFVVDGRDNPDVFEFLAHSEEHVDLDVRTLE